MSIEEELHNALQSQPKENWENCIVPRDLIERAIREITFLRSRGGAMTDGPSHADLKRRQGPQEVGDAG